MIILEIIKLIVSGAVGSVGFSIFFNARKRRIPFIALGGAVVTAVYIIAMSFTNYPLVQNLFAAIAATVYAEIMARVLKAPATPILTCSIIPLVPGGKLYYTTYYFVMGDNALFRQTLTETIEIAAGLAIGIICISVLVHEFTRSKNKNIFKE